MAERGDTHYNLRRLHQVFLLTAALTLVAAVWMVLADWDRPWKEYPRRFRELERQQVQAELAALQANEEEMQRIQELEQQIGSLEQQLEDDARYLELQEELKQARGDLYRAITDHKIAKAVANWERFVLNRVKAMSQDPEEIQAQQQTYEKAEKELEEARLAEEEAQAEVNRLEAELERLTTERDELERQLKAARRELDRIQTRLRDLADSTFNKLRDAPLLDFVAPVTKVRKQVLPNLRKNYNFLTVQRVDMCSSCHVGADQPGFEDAPMPLATHPRLDLFLAPDSPHPIESFGCTACHEGAAETLDFTRAVHTPQNEEQEADWHERLGWEHWHLWEWPMYPLQYTEAGCYSCHQLGGTLESIREAAPRLTRGLDLIEEYGCYSCHQIKGFRETRKRGPTLENIAGKVAPEWARSWIADPHQYRPSTRMPQVFHLENRVSKEWDDTAIAAIQTFLWRNSSGEEMEPIPAELAAQADVDKGRELFLTAGCTACHVSPDSEAHEYSDFGPDLAGIGSKVREEWLYHWILDPSSWWPETRMPDLRLEPEQAAHIARYLASLKAESWEPLEVAVDERVLDEQALAFLQRLETFQRSQEILAQWKQEGGTERVLTEVGRRWVARQGCYSCHDIAGFEKGMPIGTELTDWGNKNVHQLAFELFDEHLPGHFEDEAVSPSRFAFARLKLSNPRRFDRGLQVAPLDRLRMPDFKLEPDEVEAITTALLGLKDESNTILPPARPQPDEVERILEAGSYLVRQMNCYGCHRFTMDEIEAVAELDEETLVHLHGLVTFEDEDEEATYFQLWMQDPDMNVYESGSGEVGMVAELLWEYNDDEPWPVKRGLGGGIMDSLSRYFVDQGVVGDPLEAFALMPPILYREGEKVRPPWLTEFLLDPYTLRPWLSVRMPRFRLTREEARTIAQYFAALSREEWPALFTRALRSEAELSAAELAQEIASDEAMIRDIEDGGRYNENAFNGVLSWAREKGYERVYDPAPEIPFEQIEERSPSYLARMEALHPDYLTRAATLVGGGDRGINCYQCHIRDGVTPGGDPLSWGPDLAFTRERLRPDWVRRWVTDASRIYPGTKMPTALDFVQDPKLQEILEGSPEELIEAIKDFLMNSDRAREEDITLVGQAQGLPGEVPSPPNGVSDGTQGGF